MAKKRKIQGRDWHGWAWLDTSNDPNWEGKFGMYAVADKPNVRERPTDSGKWVRVKFVEVD